MKVSKQIQMRISLTNDEVNKAIRSYVIKHMGDLELKDATEVFTYHHTDEESSIAYEGADVVITYDREDG